MIVVYVSDLLLYFHSHFVIYTFSYNVLIILLIKMQVILQFVLLLFHQPRTYPPQEEFVQWTCPVALQMTEAFCNLIWHRIG